MASVAVLQWFWDSFNHGHVLTWSRDEDSDTARLQLGGQGSDCSLSVSTELDDVEGPTSCLYKHETEGCRHL